MAENNLKRADGLPPAMMRLVRELSRLPGVGEKTASRLAFNLLNRPRDEVIALAEALLEMKERVGLCSQCFALADAPRCRICEDPEREHEVICVVEGPADLMAIERARTFGGLYHVLHGAIAPLDGIGPDDLKLKELLMRLEGEAAVREVIIATNATAETFGAERLLAPRLLTKFPAARLRAVVGGGSVAKLASRATGELG